MPWSTLIILAVAFPGLGFYLRVLLKESHARVASAEAAAAARAAQA